MENIEPIIPSSQDRWLKLIDILQNDLNLDVYPGGYSAITGWYHRHDFIFHPIIEKLALSRCVWVKSLSYGCNYVYGS